MTHYGHFDNTTEIFQQLLTWNIAGMKIEKELEAKIDLEFTSFIHLTGLVIISDHAN